MEKNNIFAVIDTETTWGDEVMSIGIVIADANTKNEIDAKYFLIDPEYKQGGMYSGALRMQGIKETITDTRANAMSMIDGWLKEHKVG